MKIKIGLFVLWIFLFGMGVFIPFLPSDYIAAFSAFLAIILTIIIYKNYNFLIDEILDFFKKKYYSKIIKLFAFVLIFLFLFETFGRPIPFIVNIFLGKPHTELTKICEKDYSIGKGSQRYYIVTEGKHYFLINRGITVSEKEYKKYKIGDEVYLKGKKSFLGMSIVRVLKK